MFKKQKKQAGNISSYTHPYPSGEKTLPIRTNIQRTSMTQPITNDERNIRRKKFIEKLSDFSRPPFYKDEERWREPFSRR